ncbi:CaiB/BaiF CoA-transferase family protein [Salarchaeum sp. JOR-1]|uniref:CaiB/BaiF CoA transferase family protein n=1 Tax=Salarchaeum sp. JOR-1 TaxID=2599399 RepID=UPI0011986BAB|nr:CaiB/BaiF CoA-transferase family protein [Salarchaeum sp. JOR-1]QDX40939.1 CoA transferase [Salarchaeum sp. JOR-1]
MDLEGIRVLDLTRLLPGPYATQLLADAGADVVKVESPDRGDYARSMPPTTEGGVGRLFDAVNRGKRSVALDLTTDVDREAFYALAADADAVVEGFSPGTVDRLGVNYERVREHNEDIVYCSLSGYGQTGAFAERAGHDINYLAAAGVLDATRRDTDETPRIPGIPVADMAGGLFAAFAVAASLLSRELGNGGGYVDTSLADAALSVSQPLAMLAFDGDPRPGRTPLTGEYPWYDVYEAEDGEYVTLAALEPEFWEAFCADADRPDLVDAHGTTDPVEREALRAELESTFAERPAAEWERRCGADGMVARVRTPRDAIDAAHFRERGVVHDGRVGFPARVDGDVPAAGESVPDLGEHTGELLREAGVDPDDR